MKKILKIKKIKIKNWEYKKRYLIFITFLLCLFFISFSFLKPTIANYRSSSSPKLNTKYAAYLLGEKSLSFQLPFDGLVPSENAYESSFSIMNYQNDKKSDVDIEYELKIRTTTNLPLKYELYRYREGSSTTSSNLLSGEQIRRDIDGSWYNEFLIKDKVQMSYRSKICDTYTLKVIFDQSYSKDLEYTDLIEAIEITINSKQIVE